KPPQRISPTTAWHEMKTLRAAVRYYARIDRTFVAPQVKMPTAAPARVDYFLTRKDLADRIRAARHNPKAKHLVRVLLIGVYTGTRPGAVRKFMWVRDAENGWIDFASNTVHRQGYAKSQSTKRWPPCAIPTTLRRF